MSPLPKIPQQGDAQRLAQVASGLKREGGTYGAVVQRNPTGRPQGSTGTPAPRASKAPQQFQVPPEHEALGASLAEAESTRVFWEQWIQKFPGPNSEYYLEMATAAAEKAKEDYYTGTPNFET